jgi:hypothetical protein
MKNVILFSLLLIMNACSNSNNGTKTKTDSSTNKGSDIKDVAIVKNNSVLVTFLDSTTQVINDLKFQYEWMFENDKQYLNPPHYYAESDDFHYRKIVHGIEVDKIIYRDSISRITFNWPNNLKEGDYKSPDLIIITSKSNKVQKINRDDFSAASTFLNEASNKESSVIYLVQINLIGFGNIDGQKGKFIAQISFDGSIKVKKSESIKEIAF